MWPSTQVEHPPPTPNQRLDLSAEFLIANAGIVKIPGTVGLLKFAGGRKNGFYRIAHDMNLTDSDGVNQYTTNCDQGRFNKSMRKRDTKHLTQIENNLNDPHEALDKANRGQMPSP